jgi:glycosyltransferase involved in cell wall biosynthesis
VLTHPSISVVIPTHNRGYLLERTLDSVLAQSYAAHEVIVVDDASTDDTSQVLKPYVASGRIRLIRHEQNQERAASRNSGMEAATGDYLTLLDSDDVLYVDCLSTVAQTVRAHPEYTLVHCLYELLDSSLTPIHRYQFPDLSDRKRAIAQGNFLSCIGVFMHRELYTAYRFDTNPAFVASEDWEFWLRVLADHELNRIPVVCCANIHHERRSITQMDIAETADRKLRIIDKVRNDAHLSTAYGRYLASMPAHAFAFVATVANANRQYRTSLAYLLKALRCDPAIVMTRKFVRTLLIALLRLEHKTSSGGQQQKNAAPQV